ncbi:hypothetical protein KO02_16280 [Sphingobacterium sp. ML3W]|uniref:DUF3164 family protein n=1 Tax=Sphingobacterium sp. ML3W TaxID=1538644 RepID=UPI0004F5A49C|nr:DUF3164 family protein [Sphingobacterium sp. ML3W]AIM38068.1 hypothetical protein KO02_16280 [Sphingobacterium sp. ML3W]
MNDISRLTADERKALMAELAKEEKAEKKKRLNAKKKYESNKDTSIEELMEEAVELSLTIARFKKKAHAVMDIHREAINEYGGIRSNSQGGFTIENSQNNKRIMRRRDTDPSWDERANKAVEIIKDFLLSEGIKKTSGKIHPILMGFIQRNNNGDLEYAKVMELLEYEDTFQDPRWVKGLQLIKEGYSITFKKFGYEFKTKDKNGKWNRLELNFSSL